jgi:glycosyltransferase involved in cell wall biosynthesis
MKKILITCDSYQLEKNKKGKVLISGVKTHITNTVKELERQGFEVSIVHPNIRLKGKKIYTTITTPVDRHFSLVVNPFIATASYIKSIKPDAIFISTPEAPLGIATLAATRVLARHTHHKRIPFTTSYHTNMDICVEKRISQMTRGMLNISGDFVHPLVYIVNKEARKIMVPTKSIEKKMHEIGLKNTVVCPRGVDSKMFRPKALGEATPYRKYRWYTKNPSPLLLYFGRVSLEKNMEDFLDMEAPNMYKVVIGDGPDLKDLKDKYKGHKDIHFLGSMFGEKLAKHVRFADLMVFPSKFDTFGNVITEAGASGVPTLAFRVMGPKDVVKKHMGVLVSEGNKLEKGLKEALALDRRKCFETTLKNYSWEKSTRILVKQLGQIKWR